MSVEGARLYTRTSDDVLRLHAPNPKRVLAFNLGLGWGIPFFITAVFVAIGWTLNSYMKENYFHQMGNGAGLPKYDICWLDSSSAIYFASVVAPITIALILNLLITSKVSFLYLVSYVDDHLRYRQCIRFLPSLLMTRIMP